MPTGKIVGLNFTPGSGIAEVIFPDKRVPIEAGFGIRQLSAAFGNLPNALGKVIEYELDERGVMKSFNKEDD